MDGGISGVAVARKIKEYSGTRTILISAYTPDAILLRELEEQLYSKVLKKANLLKKPNRVSE